PGEVVGTPAYMSPEQVDGLPLDGRSDLFSLGCVLYRLAAGAAPFRGSSMTAVLRAVAEHPPPPPGALRAEVPPAVSDQEMRVFAKDPAQRPASARVVVEALDAIERGLPAAGAATPAQGELGLPRSAKPAARRWRRCAGAAGVLTAAGVVLAVL